MLIRLRNGDFLKAVALAQTRSWMRVAAIGADDVVELRLRGSHWVDEGNQPVQFEFTGMLGSGFSWQGMAEDAKRQASGPRRFDAPSGAVSIC
jgi:hypothetical protein